MADDEIRPIADDDLERWHRLRQQAFGGGGSSAGAVAFLGTIPEDRRLGAYRGGELVASAVDNAFVQTYGPVGVPCGGVASVIVAPEARGGDLARRLLAALFDRMAEAGEPISALFPTTATLYRTLGYEIVGDLIRRDLPITSLPTSVENVGPVQWSPTTLDDSAVATVDRTAASRHTGWLARPDARFRSMAAGAAHGGDPTYCFVGRRGDEPVAVVAYENGDLAPDGLQILDAYVIAAVDAGSWRQLFAFVARHGTMASAVRVETPGSLLRQVVPQLQRGRSWLVRPWMLRVGDPAAAVAARAYSPALTGTVELDLEPDPLTGAQGGAHIFEVDGGNGRLHSGGAGTVTMRRTTLAQLYAGADVTTLAAAGSLSGADAADRALLAAAFADRPEVQFFF